MNVLLPYKIAAKVLAVACAACVVWFTAAFSVSTFLTASVSGPLAHAQPLPAPQDLSVYLTDHAMRDYVLNCAGCHRLDGKGAEHLGIPDFRAHIGIFTHLPQGREYLFRVPGAAQALLSDERLAHVLNWIIATYDAQRARQPGYAPFTGAEVATARARRYDDVAKIRRELTQQLQAIGLEPAPYTYGASNLP